MPVTIDELVARHVGHLEQGKFHYQEADDALAELLQRLRAEGRLDQPLIRADTGEVYELVDNFADKNTAFRACGVKRFELKPVGRHKKRARQPAA